MIIHKKLTCKRAAMFGLDARIALAIFGALSVISGAALYSAIKQAKIVQYVAHMAEYAKAYEQFYLDTGVNIPGRHDNTSTSLKGKNLIANVGSIANWNGPYINLESYGGSNPIYVEEVLKDILGNDTYLRKASYTAVWGGGAPFPSTCVSDCAIWYEVDVLDESTVDAIDLAVDGELGRTTGKIRIVNSGSDRWLFYKIGVFH